MATKRLIEALANSVEEKVDAERLLAETPKVYSCSHEELAKWLGERGKKVVKSLAGQLAASKRISSVMPTLRRQLEVRFAINTRRPESRYARPGPFSYEQLPGDVLVEGVFSSRPDCYEKRVVIHGYRVVRGYSTLPEMNTTLQWNVDDMVRATIDTMNNTRSFLDKSIKCEAYAELADLPNPGERVMAFVKSDLPTELHHDVLLPHPRTIFSHRIAKCIASLSESTVRNGTVPLELVDPAQPYSEPVPCIAMHATHLMATYLLANDSEFELHFARLPSAKLESAADRCLMVMPRQLFERYVPQLLDRFANKAPTFDPNRMCFGVSCLHRPELFDQRVFAPDEEQEFDFESRWIVELEFSLVPRQILGHAPLFDETYSQQGADNTERIQRYLKAKETARRNEETAAQLQAEFDEHEQEYEAAVSGSTDVMVE